MLDTQMQQRNRHSKTIRCLEARAIEESCAFAHPLRGRFELGPKWHNTPSVFPKHTRQTLPFQSVAVLLVVSPTSYADPHNSTSVKGFKVRPAEYERPPVHGRRHGYRSSSSSEGVGGMIPTARNLLTRPPTGTPRRAMSPSEGSPRPRVARATWAHRKHECLDVIGSFINPCRLFRKAVQQGRSE